MTDKEAMKLALDALEYIDDGANNQGAHIGISWRCVSTKAEPAIAALKERLAQPEQEPVAWVVYDHENNDVAWSEAGKTLKAETPLYTTPPQRTWVGLTPYEVFGISDQHPVEGFDPDIMAYTRAIEAKLKQKNGYAEENT